MTYKDAEAAFHEESDPGSPQGPGRCFEHHARKAAEARAAVGHEGHEAESPKTGPDGHAQAGLPWVGIGLFGALGFPDQPKGEVV